MTAALLITLRETLEASLVVGIALAYVRQVGTKRHEISVWMGTAAGIVASLILAYLLSSLSGSLPEGIEEIYEGAMMLTAAGLLTWMILWMLNQHKHVSRLLKQKVAGHVEQNQVWGLFLLALTGTAREGAETVLFLQASILNSGENNQILGAILGIVIAIVASYILFRGALKLPLKQFFSVTSILLILFAAGLVAHGIHEFEEAGLITLFSAQAWNLSSVLPEKSAFGSFLKALFGYNETPSILQVISYFAYLTGIGLLWNALTKNTTQQTV